jgi:WD40 repeat protein
MTSGRANVFSAAFEISLFQNDRLLAIASRNHTACLWNLDTNLPVEPPLHHKAIVFCTVIPADGKLLATGCDNANAHMWDVGVILKNNGHEDLLSINILDVSSHSISSQ